MSVRRLAKEQPASFAFTPETLEKAQWWIAKYPPGRQQSAVIADPVAGAEAGGLGAEPALRVVAELLGMPVIRVFEVATFYTMFQLEPVGTVALIQVCGTTPCMLRGANELMELLEKRSARRTTAAPTASSPGKRSSAWAPASTRRWPRSTTTTTRT